MKSDLKNAATGMETAYAGTAVYPPGSTTPVTLNATHVPGYKASGVGASIYLVLNDAMNAYCLVAHNDNGSQQWVYVSNGGGLQARTVTTVPSTFAAS